jgi:hypothetical protein
MQWREQRNSDWDHTRTTLQALRYVRFNPAADMAPAATEVGCRPNADSCAAANAVSYSMTSSARPSTASGTVSPSAFAVLRLITSSKLADCCTGNSAGGSPFKIRPT